MTRDEATEKLNALNGAIANAVLLIRMEAATIERFLKEARDMDNFGHIVDPTLFKSSERRVTTELLKPVYEAALDLVKVYDGQVAKARSAMDAVKTS